MKGVFKMNKFRLVFFLTMLSYTSIAFAGFGHFDFYTCAIDNIPVIIEKNYSYQEYGLLKGDDVIVVSIEFLGTNKNASSMTLEGITKNDKTVYFPKNIISDRMYNAIYDKGYNCKHRRSIY